MKKILTIFIIFSSVQYTYSQITASFTAPDIHCGQTIVTFINTSTSVNGIDNVFWDFGCGNSCTDTASALAAFSYPQAGTYLVTLIVQDTLGNTDTLSKPITIIDEPNVDFSVTPLFGCNSFTITLEDTVNKNLNSNNWGWTWVITNDSSYCDTIASNIIDKNNADPFNYTVHRTGSYTISLTVENSGGCKKTVTKTDIFVAHPTPEADFSYQMTTNCDSTSDIQFTNLSTNCINPLLYEWIINGTSIFHESPPYIYNGYGCFDALLIVTDSLTGCSDTIIQNLCTPPNDTASFSFSKDIVCIGDSIQFTDLSTGNPFNWHWDFGDMTTSTLQHPKHTYDSSGNYEVILTITTQDSCERSYKKTMVVAEDPIIHDAKIIGDNYACTIPHTINFTCNLSDSTIVNWYSNNILFSQTLHPQRTFNDYGIYVIELEVISQHGCVTRITVDTITLTPLIPDFVADTLSACDTLFVQFSDLSIVSQQHITDSIVSWEWDFGDSSPKSNLPSPSHGYLTGIYDVSLTVENTLGCVQTLTKPQYIGVGTIPTLDFSISDSALCSSDSIVFTPISSHTLTSVSWSFGDGDTSTQRITTHSYSDTGAYTVTLTGYNYACVNTVTKDSLIEITSPVASFEDSTGCGNTPKTYFTNTSIGYVSSHWRFYDMTSDNPLLGTANSEDTCFTFPHLGTFEVELTVTDVNGCTNSVRRIITITQPQAGFVFTPSKLALINGCYPQNTVFTVTSNASNFTGQTWSVSNGNITTLPSGSIEVTFNTSGNLMITQTVVDENGCIDTKTTIICIVSIISDIDTCTLDTCLSTCFAKGGIALDTIGTGQLLNGELCTLDSAGMENPGKIIHVRDDTVSIVNIPNDFKEYYTGCIPLTVAFRDSSTVFNDSIVHRIWNFGDGDTSHAINPTHVYDSATNGDAYLVSLTAITASGKICYRELNTVIRPTQPIAFFDVSKDSTCIDSTVHFINRSIGACNNIDYLWEFKDDNNVLLGSAVSQNAFFQFQTGGWKEICLTVTDYNGCDSTYCQSILIENPIADFQIIGNAITACQTILIDVQNNSTNAIGYIWDLGNGTSEQHTPTLNPYTISGDYDISLIAYSNHCSSVLTVPNAVIISGPTLIDTSATPNKGCAPYQTYFSVDFLNADEVLIIPHAGDTLTHFTTGLTTIADSFFYQSKGVYYPEIILKDTAGCIQLFQLDSVIVNELEANILIDNTIGCVPYEITPTFITNQVITYHEWLADSSFIILDGTTVKPTIKIDSAGKFSPIRLIIENNKGCRDTISTDSIIGVKAVPSFERSVAGGCIPLDVQFTDSSQAICDTIKSWKYQFSQYDTLISNLQHPLTTYNIIPPNHGVDSVKLVITTGIGCTASLTLPIHPTQPNSSYTTNDTIVCIGQNVSFQNTSTGVVINYHWDFGDSTTSSEENPTHVYTDEGIYNVCLTVTDSNSCDSIYCDTIIVANPIANFTVADTAITCAPESICFIDSSKNAHKIEWFYRPSSSSTWNVADSCQTFVTSGSYDVMQVVTSISGCIDTLIRQNYITVSRPTATIAYAPIEGCVDLELQVTITNIENIDIIIFEPKAGATLKAFFVTDTVLTITHLYQERGLCQPTIFLQQGGCEKSELGPLIHITDPTVEYTLSQYEGCDSFNVEVTNNSIDAATYQWLVTNNAIISNDTIAEPSIYFPDTGIYTVTCVITDIYGCTDEQSQEVKVNGIYAGGFASTNVGCRSLFVQFTDTSSVFSKNEIVNWYWDFGTPTGDFSTEQHPSFTYTENGIYPIQLTVTDSFSCSKTIMIDTIWVTHPTALFTPSITYACTGQAIDFTNQSIGESNTCLWDFGNSDTTTQCHPRYAYEQEGTYIVCLTVTDINNCDSMYCDTIIIADPKAYFTTDTNRICIGESIQFTNTSHNAVLWEWRFEDGTIYQQQHPTHTYTRWGWHTDTLIVTSSGCQDTFYMSQHIFVGGPTGSIVALPDSGCSPLDATIHIVGDNLFSATLDVDENNLSNIFYNPNHLDTIPLSYHHTYYQSGIKTPTVLFQDTLGCELLLNSNDIEVDTLQIDFTASATLICEGEQITFTPSIAGNKPIDSILWTFEGGTPMIYDQLNPTITYDNYGLFNVQLTVVSGHCIHTITKNIEVAPKPTANFVVNPYVLCTGETVNFTNLSSVPVDNLHFWEWKDNGMFLSHDFNPQPIFNVAGIHEVELLIQTDKGCWDSTTHLITVNQTPTAGMEIEDTLVCKGKELNLIGTGGYTYNWFLPNNAINCSTCDTTTAIFTTSSDIVLTVTSSAGCSNTISQPITVLPNIQPTITLSEDTTLCKGDTIQLLATGNYNDVLLYHWNTTNTGLTCYNGCTNPFATPSVTTTYFATLTNAVGCFATDSVTITVVDENLDLLADTTTICEGDNIILDIGVPLSAQWSPTDGLSCTYCPDPIASPAATTTYSVLVYSANNNCKIEDQITVKILENDVDAGTDKGSCIGNPVILNDATGTGHITWSPADLLSDETMLHPTAFVDSTTIFVLTVDKWGICKIRDSLTITVTETVEIEVKDTAICEGNSVELMVEGYTETITWFLDGVPLNSTLVTPTQTTTYMVVGEIASCIADTAYLEVIVYPLPNIGLSPTQEVFPNTPTILDLSNPNPNYNYFWYSDYPILCEDCAVPMINVDSNAIYYVTVTDGITGCVFVDSISIVPIHECSEDHLYLPNTFTPNGDGANDIFLILGNVYEEIETFVIVDRNYQEVFKTSDINEGWNGQSKGKNMPQSVYTYYVTALCPLTGETIMKKGTVTLVR